MYSHNAGAYNFALYKEESTRTNKFPDDLKKVIRRVATSNSGDIDENRHDDYRFLAKFAVAHRSHRQGLMPFYIVQWVCWQTSEIEEILESAGVPEVEGIVKPIVKPTIEPAQEIKPIVKPIPEPIPEPVAKTAKAPVPAKSPEKEDKKPAIGQTHGRFAASRGVKCAPRNTPKSMEKKEDQ